MLIRPLFPLLAALLLTACQPEGGAPSAPPATGNPKVPAGAKSSGGRHAVLQLEKGEFELELLPEAAPRAVENFRLLAEQGGLGLSRPEARGYRAPERPRWSRCRGRCQTRR